MESKGKNFAIIAVVVGAVIFSGMKVTTSHDQADASMAKAVQVQGCYIFVDSNPVTQYQYLGTVKLTAKDIRKSPGSGQYQYVRDLLLDKIKKEYSNANGAIFHFHDGGTDEADAIKF